MRVHKLFLSFIKCVRFLYNIYSLNYQFFTLLHHLLFPYFIFSLTSFCGNVYLFLYDHYFLHDKYFHNYACLFTCFNTPTLFGWVVGSLHFEICTWIQHLLIQSKHQSIFFLILLLLLTLLFYLFWHFQITIFITNFFTLHKWQTLTFQINSALQLLFLPCTL